MRPLIFILLQLSLPFMVAAQSHCDTLSEFQYKPVNNTKVQTLRDYLTHILNKKDDISCTRSESRKMSVWSNNEQGAEFYSPVTGIVKITTRKKSVKPFLIENTYYGIEEEDSALICIDAITFNSNIISDTIFNTLLNVNTNDTFCAIKPLEAYVSPNQKYVFIYVFGKPRLEKFILTDPTQNSYMAKLIFTTQGEYVDKVIIRGDLLDYFGFTTCCDFIGF
jgi:hypothetical protein